MPLMTYMKTILSVFLFALGFGLSGQSDTTITTQDTIQKLTVDGYIVTAMISEGDTLIIADLNEASVSMLREFESPEEAKLYRKYRYYANKAYPYAVEAIKIFRAMEEHTQGMSKRQKRKHNRKLNKELKKKFKGELKKMAKTQGFILIEMVERHLDKSMYDLIKSNRSGFTAFHWNNLGKLNGYKLKNKYTYGENRVLDIVLQDYDISHEETRPTEYLRKGVLSEKSSQETANEIDIESPTF